MAEMHEDLLWEEFHRVVNMTSEELRAFLLADASGETAFPADPDLGVGGLGRGVLHILSKRKVDLTPDDLRVMRQVIEFVEERRGEDPKRDEVRHELMSVGHDPLRD
ncbi:DUF3140 domain-containing protein [Thermoactinospora rubra]|uniref:DUF3140 domain-containing protein n=1 Tax=Thermoactinospora rubra TaxID=1088767 RepID=UPI000A109589|nr:DUF3140 domain-containing protein [Thermoactinospora rubra]